MKLSITGIVKDIEGAEHTVVGWFAKEYAAFYKDEPKLEQIVDSTVNYVEIGLPIVLDVTGGAALAPEVDAVMNEVVSDLKVVASTVYDFGPSPSAASVLASVQSNLASLETVAGIKDPAKLAKLKLIVNAVGVLGQLIAKAIAAAKAAATPTSGATAAPATA